MKYISPEVGDNKVIYKGKRYWIVEFTGKDKIHGFGRNNCQFIMYDKDYGVILAYIDFKNGEYSATLAWGIDDFMRNFDRQTLEDMFKTTSKKTIWINRFIPQLFSNIKDANAILLKVKTGTFYSRALTSKEHNELIIELKNLNFNDLTYTKYAQDTLILDTFSDTKGCLVDVYEQIKLLPNKFKIVLGFSFFDKDRVVIVKNKFWESEDTRPKGYHFIDDLI